MCVCVCMYVCDAFNKKGEFCNIKTHILSWKIALTFNKISIL